MPVFNNLELLGNRRLRQSTEERQTRHQQLRNAQQLRIVAVPGGERGPSSTVNDCSATGLLPNQQRRERERGPSSTTKDCEAFPGISVRSDLPEAHSLSVFDVYVTSTVLC